MQRSIRVKRRLLRASRGANWGVGKITNAMNQVCDADGVFTHWRLKRNPWYVHRRGIYKPGSESHRQWYRLIGHVSYHHLKMGTKARQRWLKDVEAAGRDEINHALSDCCGYGHGEAYGMWSEPYEFVSGSVPHERFKGWRKVTHQKRHRRRCR